MSPALACLDGELVPVEQAAIPVTDEGLLRGDGVFEVVRLYAGRPYGLEQQVAVHAEAAAENDERRIGDGGHRCDERRDAPGDLLDDRAC